MKMKDSLFSILFLASFISCGDYLEVDSSSSARNPALALSGTNKALVYLDDPNTLSGSIKRRADFNGILTEKFITDKQTLTKDCIFTQSIASITSEIFEVNSQVESCGIILNEDLPDATPLQTLSKNWSYEINSDEFYQVNTFYHANKIKNRFLEALSFTQKHVHFNSNMTIPPATKHNLGSTKSFWLNDDGEEKSLNIFSKCIIEFDAFFDPAKDLICFGILNEDNFKMVQDPSVIYHEMGHVFIKILMNQRNLTFESSLKVHPFESSLGVTGRYDEAGAINEAIADYFSYIMNKRPSVGDYAIRYGVGKPRPLSEDEPSHSAPVSTAKGERLSYPQYLYYDPLEPDAIVEEIHNAGGAASHYLVALTEKFKNTCSYPSNDADVIHETATNYVMLLLSESLAEIGDLTGKGSDFLSFLATGKPSLENVFFTNLNNEASFLWTHYVNPPNFRRFFQIFGKNIIHYISTDLCPEFTIDASEELLDDFGLLLFKSYENRGNGINTTNLSSQSYALHTDTKVSTSEFANRRVLFDCLLHPNFPSCTLNNRVNEANRRNSILISKDLLALDPDAPGTLFDSRSVISNVLSVLSFEGEGVATSEGLAGVEYNNDNIEFSPGEIVGLSINLRNNSNSIMGGVQILANDWDHMKLNNLNDRFINRNANILALDSGDITGGIATHSPCIFDNFPSASEGGVSDSVTTTPGNCSYISKDNSSIDNSEVVNDTIFPKYDFDAPQPICMVQFSDESDTKWVSQDFFRKNSIGLEDKDCLNNPAMSGDQFNPNECLIRVLPGGVHSMHGKIDPQKSWIESRFPEGTSKVLSRGNLILMEINKWVNSGTTFTCRFRARFSNCSDCYDEISPDPSATVEDYSDFEHAGNRPFKVIDFTFTVLD